MIIYGGALNCEAHDLVKLPGCHNGVQQADLACDGKPCCACRPKSAQIPFMMPASEENDIKAPKGILKVQVRHPANFRQN